MRVSRFTRGSVTSVQSALADLVCYLSCGVSESARILAKHLHIVSCRMLHKDLACEHFFVSVEFHASGSLRVNDVYYVT